MQETRQIAVAEQVVADGVVLRPDGTIDRDNAPSLRAIIDGAQQRNPDRLVIDLSGVPSADGAAVATLVEAMQIALRGARLLVLCGLQRGVRSQLEIARLDDKVFTIVDTVEQALALPNRRHSLRLALAQMRCNLGEVLDISASGIRLSLTRRPRGQVDLHLSHPRSDLSLRAEVVWSRRKRFRQFEAGLRFVDLPDRMAGELDEIVHRAVDRPVAVETAVPGRVTV